MSLLKLAILVPIKLALLVCWHFPYAVLEFFAGLFSDE